MSILESCQAPYELCYNSVIIDLLRNECYNINKLNTKELKCQRRNQNIM